LITPMMLPAHKTRIVTTIGPASSSRAVLEQMIRAGMNIARLNFSHGTFPDHRQNIENIRAASQAVGRPVALMADLPGPKMRIGQIADEPIHLKAGDRFTLTTANVGDTQRVSLPNRRWVNFRWNPWRCWRGSPRRRKQSAGRCR
jgi:pyruvate kinase